MELTVPIWWKTLSEDARWPGEVDWGYIRDVDSKYGQHVDLVMEARECLVWLNGPKATAAKRQYPKKVWLNWLRKALADAREAEEKATPKGTVLGAKEWIERHGLPQVSK